MVQSLVNIRLCIFFLLSLCTSLYVQAQVNPQQVWIDSVYNQMTEEERLGQMFIIAAWSNKDSSHIKEVTQLIEEHKVGGLIFFQGGPVRQAHLTNYYQSISKVPLLISIDGEWGVSMRLDSTPFFPRQMVMGSCDDDSVVYKVAAAIGQECKRLGIHLNFAPVIDINNNPNNPVINDRSFGEDKERVTRKGLAYTRGLQDQGVMACAKHFPGHGDTDSDSHLKLPHINHSAERLDSLELYPFKKQFEAGVKSVMIAHLYITAYDSSTNRASSLSHSVVTDLLKKKLGYKGLVLTDALVMKGVSSFNAPEDVNLQSVLAGNDMLLYAEEVPKSIAKIKQAIADSLVYWDDLEVRIKKILAAKYWAGLHQYKPIDTEGLWEDLNCCSTNLLIRDILKKSIIVPRNEDQLIPLKNLDQKQVACVAVGSKTTTHFQKMAHNFASMDYYHIGKYESKADFDALTQDLKTYDIVILSLHKTSRYLHKNYGLTDREISFVNTIANRQATVVVNHGNPYSLRKFDPLKHVIIAFEDKPLNNELSAQVLFGVFPAQGVLPVTVNEHYPIYSGIKTQASTQGLEYALPEEAGVNEDVLTQIDLIANEAIDKGATPGCQVLVAKQGKVIYQKSFGHFSYNKKQRVTNATVYDLASLTKILSTTLAVMRLYEQGKLELDKKISYYLPELKRTNKKGLIIQDILTHQAGLKSWIPFYKRTLVDGKLNPTIYQATPDSNYCLKVAEGIYMNKLYVENMMEELIYSEVTRNPEYLYSDLGMYLLRLVVERLTDQPFDQYVHHQFYQPLGLATMGFKPLQKMAIDRITPTEDDQIFRKQLLQGYVHDQGAAMLGGVSGHAGLFSNANDVAVIMQMLLNFGTYRDHKFFDSTTVALFTSKQFENNRRGLGFDKPETRPGKPSPIPAQASPAAFGHYGFTGTAAWADPKYDLVYIFLSNRVHPDAENKKLGKLNIRTRIQQVAYEAVK